MARPGDAAGRLFSAGFGDLIDGSWDAASGWRIECDFRADLVAAFLIGADGEKLVGRVVVNANGISMAEGSMKPSYTLALVKMAVAKGAVIRNLKVSGNWFGRLAVNRSRIA